MFSHTLRVLLASAFLTFSLACATAPGPEDEVPGKLHVTDFHAPTYLEQEARRLSPDTIALAIIDGDYIWEFFGELLPPTEGVSPVERGRALRDAFQERDEQDYLFHLAGADRLTASFSDEGLMFFFHGELAAPEGTETRQVGDIELSRIQLFPAADQEMMYYHPMQMMLASIEIWAAPLPESPGLAIFVGENAVENTFARLNGTAPSLRDAERFDAFASLFERAHDGRTILAFAGYEDTDIEDTVRQQSANMGISEPPREVLLSLGESFTLQLTGPADLLDFVETTVSQAVATGHETVAEATAMPAHHPVEMLFSNSMAFVVQTYLHALETTRQDDTLAYRLPLPESRAATLMALFMVSNFNSHMQYQRRMREWEELPVDEDYEYYDGYEYYEDYDSGEENSEDLEPQLHH